MLPCVPDDSAGDSVKGSMTLTECPELLKSRDGSMKGFYYKIKKALRSKGFLNGRLPVFLGFQGFNKKKKTSRSWSGFCDSVYHSNVELVKFFIYHIVSLYSVLKMVCVGIPITDKGNGYVPKAVFV